MKFREKICCGLLIAMCVMTSTPLYGATRTTINLPAYKRFTNITHGNRSLNYSYITVRNYAVYPANGGEDTITNIRCRILDQYDNIINNGSYVTISENETSATHVAIKEGYLSTKTIDVKLSSTTNAEARTDVSYTLN